MATDGPLWAFLLAMAMLGLGVSLGRLTAALGLDAKPRPFDEEWPT